MTPPEPSNPETKEAKKEEPAVTSAFALRFTSSLTVSQDSTDINDQNPPFLHDIRVFLNPSRPARTVATDSERSNYALIVTDMETALNAAIRASRPSGPGARLPAGRSDPERYLSGESARPAVSVARLAYRCRNARRLSPREPLQVILSLKSL